MGQSGDFYIAWDGRRYEGMPPAGWFLAADNRWWPTPDIIEDRQAAGNDAEQAARTELDELPQPVEISEPAAVQPPSPSSPTPAALPEAATPPGTRPTVRPRRRNIRWIVQLLFFVFIFRGCLGLPNFSSDSETIASDSPAPTFEVAAPQDYEATINPCLGNAPTGLIRNQTDTRARFNVVVDVTTATGASETWTSPPTLTIEPGVLTSWTTVIPPGSAPATECSIASVESKAITD